MNDADELRAVVAPGNARKHRRRPFASEGLAAGSGTPGPDVGRTAPRTAPRQRARLPTPEVAPAVSDHAANA